MAGTQIRLIYFSTALLFHSFIQFSQAQILKGKITDQENGEALIGASVFIPETGKGIYTDENGNFSISGLKAGKYSLICSYPSYIKDTLQNIELISGHQKNLHILLRSETYLGLDEIIITETRNLQSDKSLITDLKTSNLIVSGVSAEQIRKSPDRDAAEVIRRLPGVTLNGNNYAMIRGLNERYNQVLMHGGTIPASESDSKAFSFDMIPSGMISRLMIQKIPSADLPAEMAGGIIQIETQAMPSENSITAGVSLGLRQYTSLRDFSTQNTSGFEWTGFAGKTRDLPPGFPEHLNTIQNPAYLNTLSKSLPNTWGIQSQTAMPDIRLHAGFSRKFTGKKHEWGTHNGFTYSNTKTHNTLERYNYNAFDTETQKSDTIYHYTDAQYSQSFRSGLMSNWALRLHSGHTIELRNLLNQNGTLNTILRSGKNLEEGSEVKNYSLGWTERSLYSGQISGLHPIRKNTNIDWLAGYGICSRKEPDLKRLRTIRPLHSPGNTAFQIVIPPGASTLDASRFFSESREQTLQFNSNVHHTYFTGTHHEIKLSAGIRFENKSRNFRARWMSYKRGNQSRFNTDLIFLDPSEVFSPEHMDIQSGFVLHEGSNPSDANTGSSQNQATYLSADIAVLKRLSLQTGLRLENNHQKLSSRDYNNQAVEVNNSLLNLLPSASLNYRYNAHSNIKALGGMSLNRPEFRELAPFAYYDFTFNNVLYGNPELKTSVIQNFDLRWEYYPSVDEFIHFGAFIKKFTNPIEQVFVPGTGSGGTRNFTFTNASTAHSIGIETEIRKSLKKTIPLPIIQNTGILLNIAFIQSQVNLGTAARGQMQVRPMQGQAPYVINGSLYYQTDSTGTMIMLQYNLYGKRLFAAGTFGTPDIYEMPRHQLDLNISQKIFKRAELRLSIQDILNATYKLQQDSNEDGAIDSDEEIILNMKRGRICNLGFQYTF